MYMVLRVVDCHPSDWEMSDLLDYGEAVDLYKKYKNEIKPGAALEIQRAVLVQVVDDTDDVHPDSLK